MPYTDSVMIISLLYVKKEQTMVTMVELIKSRCVQSTMLGGCKQQLRSLVGIKQSDRKWTRHL